MSTNWAVFNDGGCLESQYTEEQAKARAAQMVAEGDDLVYASTECHDHEGHPADTCEMCNADDETDEE